MRSIIILLAASVAGAVACSSNDSPSGDLSGDGDDKGEVGAPGDGDGDEGSGRTPLEPSEGWGRNTGTGGTDGTGGSETGGGSSLGGASSVGFPTLSDYIDCSTDDDCPNSLGWECMTQLPLSHEDADGERAILVSDLGPSRTGICARDCSQDADACSDLNLDSFEGTAPFTCHVVWAGESPYVDDQLFPFDDQLSNENMTEGVAFAAVCRPPFELGDERSATFCSPCSGASDCSGTDICWDPLTEGTDPGDGSGLCAEACTDVSDCPLGFTCDAVDGAGDFCVPLEATCDSCSDRDGDERGAGYCSEAGTDCDDTNADAYWDEDDENHPFPEFCGTQDYNCNGKSDDVEILDPNENALLWGATHCGACGSPCTTATPENVQNGALGCIPNGNNGQCDAICDDVESHADCDDDIYNGCETPVDGSLYWPDDDEDTFGDQGADPEFPCGEDPEPGWVTNDADCNDNAAGINPDVSEVCDNIDNDCDESVDEDLTPQAHYRDTDGDGQGDDNTPPEMLCVWAGGGEDDRESYSLVLIDGDCDDSRGDVYTGAPEMCESDTDSGLLVDEDCNGEANEGGDTVSYYLDADKDGTFEGAAWVEPSVTYACVAPTTNYVRWSALVEGRRNGDCDDDDKTVYPGADELCDGKDNDCNGGTADGIDELLWGTDCVVEDGANYCELNGSVASCSGGLLGCVEGSPLTTDLPGDDLDDNCDGFDHDVSKSVYVIPGSSDGGDGSQENPYNNITTAYSAVASSGGAKDTIVLGLDPDTTSSYEFDDALDLVEGVHLVGGYTAETDDNANYTDWTFSGTATPLTRNWVVVDERVVVMTATDISDETVLANFDLISSDPPIGPAAAGEDGTNVYGLIATDASGLHLIGVEISLGDATDGGAGEADGEDGTPGPNSISNLGAHQDCITPSGTPIRTSGGAEIQPGFGLQPGSAGGGDATYATWMDQVNGGYFDGDAGRLFFVGDNYNWVRQPMVPTVGLPGSGGGGGFPDGPAPGGGGGAGGCGGEPGESGGNGGGLFGVLIVSGDLALGGLIEVTTGNAGLGGAGTDGGDGGSGGTGADIGDPSGGHGSGGLGGGGGAGGHGGHNIGVLSLGVSADSCSTTVTTTLGCSGEPGTAGATGAAGNRSGGSSAPTADNGAPGHWGWKDTCFDGDLCYPLGDDCGADEVCKAFSPGGFTVCLPDRDDEGSLTCSRAG